MLVRTEGPPLPGLTSQGPISQGPTWLGPTWLANVAGASNGGSDPNNMIHATDTIVFLNAFASEC